MSSAHLPYLNRFLNMIINNRNSKPTCPPPGLNSRENRENRENRLSWQQLCLGKSPSTKKRPRKITLPCLETEVAFKPSCTKGSFSVSTRRKKKIGGKMKDNKLILGKEVGSEEFDSFLEGETCLSCKEKN